MGNICQSVSAFATPRRSNHMVRTELLSRIIDRAELKRIEMLLLLWLLIQWMNGRNRRGRSVHQSAFWDTISLVCRFQSEYHMLEAWVMHHRVKQWNDTVTATNALRLPLLLQTTCNGRMYRVGGVGGGGTAPILSAVNELIDWLMVPKINFLWFCVAPLLVKKYQHHHQRHLGTCQVERYTFPSSFVI